MRVVLIGGPFRVGPDLVFDSRTALEEDAGDYLIRSAASSSLQWWEAATTFAQTLLAQDRRSDAWIMVAGPPLLRTRTEDGKVVRQRLTSILPGEAVVLDTGDFRRTPVAPWTYVHTTSHITFVQKPCPITAWARCAPTALIVSGHDDRGPRGTRLIELATLWPTTVMILLHSPDANREVQALLAWVEAGGKPLSRSWSPTRDQDAEHQRRMAARMKFGRERPVVTDADFGITSAFLDGRVIPPERLAAGAAFLQSRYDLSIDIWDIVKDAALSSLILESERGHVVARGDASASVPFEFMNRVRKIESIRKAVDDQLADFPLGPWTMASEANFSWKLVDPEYPVEWVLRLDSTSCIVFPTGRPEIRLPLSVTGGQGWHHGIGWRVGIAPEGMPGLRSLLDDSLGKLREIVSRHFATGA